MQWVNKNGWKIESLKRYINNIFFSGLIQFFVFTFWEYLKDMKDIVEIDEGGTRSGYEEEDDITDEKGF